MRLTNCGKLTLKPIKLLLNRCLTRASRAKCSDCRVKDRESLGKLSAAAPALPMELRVQIDLVNHVLAGWTGRNRLDPLPANLHVSSERFDRRIDEAKPAPALILRWPFVSFRSVARVACPQKVRVSVAQATELVSPLGLEMLDLEAAVGIARRCLTFC